LGIRDHAEGICTGMDVRNHQFAHKLPPGWVRLGIERHALGESHLAKDFRHRERGLQTAEIRTGSGIFRDGIAGGVQVAGEGVCEGEESRVLGCRVKSLGLGD